MIDAREYGPADGLSVDVEQFEITPGGDAVGRYFTTTDPNAMMTPMATWGSSYAISTEIASLYYQGRAKAAGNIYDGKRIISVCFWYSRGTENKSSTYCSNASSSGSTWRAGPEVSHGVWDTLKPGEQNRTIFNIKTSRIDPRIF